jgi:hypothetical protein
MTVGIGPVPDWSARSAKFYIQVDDIEETLARVEEAGGQAVMPRTVGPEFGATSWCSPPSSIRPVTKSVSSRRPRTEMAAQVSGHLSFG